LEKDHAQTGWHGQWRQTVIMLDESMGGKFRQKAQTEIEEVQPTDA